MLAAVTESVWSRVLPALPNEEWQIRARRLTNEAERRRKRAKYNTGSILESEAYALIALAEFFTPRVVVEVGTFVGLSTTALASGSTVETVYTCDASNDCLPSDDVIRTYPLQTSTQMLRDLVTRGVRADFCFFDGAMNAEDVELLQCLTTPETVYAVHDYNYGIKERKSKRGGVSLETVPYKGIGNIWLLKPTCPGYMVIAPQPESTLALFLPESRL